MNYNSHYNLKGYKMKKITLTLTIMLLSSSFLYAQTDRSFYENISNSYKTSSSNYTSINKRSNQSYRSTANSNNVYNTNIYNTNISNTYNTYNNTSNYNRRYSDYRMEDEIQRRVKERRMAKREKRRIRRMMKRERELRYSSYRRDSHRDYMYRR